MGLTPGPTVRRGLSKATILIEGEQKKIKTSAHKNISELKV